MQTEIRVNIGSGNGLVPPSHYLNQCWMMEYISEGESWASMEEESRGRGVSTQPCGTPEVWFNLTHCGVVMLWWQRSGSTLYQIMAWCLTVPSHCLKQWGPVTSPWALPLTIFMKSVAHNVIENNQYWFSWGLGPPQLGAIPMSAILFSPQCVKNYSFPPFITAEHSLHMIPGQGHVLLWHRDWLHPFRRLWWPG